MKSSNKHEFHQDAFKMSLVLSDASNKALRSLSDTLCEYIPYNQRGNQPKSFDIKLLSFTSYSPEIIKSDVCVPFHRIMNNHVFFGAKNDKTSDLVLVPSARILDRFRVITWLNPKLNRSHPAFCGSGTKVIDIFNDPDQYRFIRIYDLMRTSKSIFSEDILRLSYVHIDLFYSNGENYDELYEMVEPVEISFKCFEIQGLSGNRLARMYINF